MDIILLQPPQSRLVPGELMSVAWLNQVAGDRVGATCSGGGQTITTFDGYNDVPGLSRAADDSWLIDLNFVDPAVDAINLWVHAARDGRRSVRLSDLNSSAEIEHSGLAVPRGSRYEFLRLDREFGRWKVTALLSDNIRQPLLTGAETVVFALDRSASMLNWYHNGAVARLIAAVQDVAREVHIPALRVTFDGDGQTQLLQSSEPAAAFVDSQLDTLRFSTGSDCVASAAAAVAQAGSGKRVTILVTDSPPVGDVSALSNNAGAVIAVLGMHENGAMVDAGRWDAIRTSTPVVALGDADQASDEIVGLLSDAIQGVH